MDNYEFEQIKKIMQQVNELYGYAKVKKNYNNLQANAIINEFIKLHGGDYNLSEVSFSQEVKGEKMKYVTKRSDGRWQARKTINGKRICVYGNTQKEAYEKLKSKTKTKIKSTQTPSLAEFAINYIQDYKKNNVTNGTYKCYLSNVKRYINLKTPINRIKLEQLQDLINKLPQTRIRLEVCQLIRQIFRKAYELDIIKKDISEFIEKGKIITTERRALTLEEQTALIKQLGTDDFSIRVWIYLCTGIRPNEIKTIKPEELKTGWIKINGTKTAKAERWIKISDKLYNLLKGKTQEFYKFDSKRFRQRLQKTCKKANIKYEVSAYIIRHTFATNLYIIGIPEKDRQQYLGHSTGSKITNDVYTTFTPDVKAEDIYNIYKDFYPKF